MWLDHTRRVAGVVGSYNAGYAPDMSTPAPSLAPTTRVPTLGELVDLPGAALHVVHSPGGAAALERPVRWVHSTELADPSRYLRGEELVCTVGTSLLDSDTCRRFVAALAGVGVAGICFGVGDVHRHTPPAVIEACRDVGVPLFEVPYGVRFLALSEHLAALRARAESQLSARGERLVAELLGEVRRGAEAVELVAAVVAHLGGRLVATLGEVRIEAGDPATTGPAVEVAAADSVAVRWTGTGEPPSAELLVQIGRVLDVAWFERESDHERHRERIGQLFGLVADGLADVASILPTLADHDLADRPVTVSAWPARTGRVLTAALPGAVIADAPDTTFAVCADPAEIERAAAELALACGHGSSVRLAGLSRSIAEARACLQLARRYGRLVGPHELTSLDGLLEQQPAARLTPFVTQLVAPLLDYDRRQRGDLLATLSTFLRTNGSLQQTAQERFLHVNTVRHRLGRVRELTGRDPLVFDDRAALAIALWAHERSQRRPWSG